MNTYRVTSSGGQEWGRYGGVGPAMVECRRLAGDNIGQAFTVEKVFYDDGPDAPPVWAPITTIRYPPRVPAEPPAMPWHRRGR